MDCVSYGELFRMVVPDSRSGKISKDMFPHINTFLENEICGNGANTANHGQNLITMTNNNDVVAYLINTAADRERGDADPKLTYQHLTALARLGIGSASYLAGKMCFDGYGTNKNDNSAAAYFIEAIEATSQPVRGRAFDALSTLISGSRSLSSQTAEKIEELYKKHDCFNGFIKYQLELAIPYTAEYRELFLGEIYKKGLATNLIDAVNQDIPGALKELASAMCDRTHELYGTVTYGDWPNLNRTKCFKRAADELNIPEAAYQYAKKCEAGEYSFFSEFVIFPQWEAIKYDKIAAAQGHTWARRTLVDKGEDLSYAYSVGISCLQGDGADKSDYNARNYLKIALENQCDLAENVNSETPEVAYQIACLFEDDKTFPTVFPALLQMAANKGYEPAILEQKARSGDNIAAIKLYQLHSTGQTSLGQLSNEGIPLTCLIQAANNGSKEAFDILSKLRSPPKAIYRPGFTAERVALIDTAIQHFLQKEEPREAYLLARNYLTGNPDLGIPENLESGLAKKYFSFAIRLGVDLMDLVTQEPPHIVWQIAQMNLVLPKNAMNKSNGVKISAALFEFLEKNDYQPAVLRKKALEGDRSAAFKMYQLLKNGDEQAQLMAQPEIDKYAISYLASAIKGGYSRAIKEANTLIDSGSIYEEEVHLLRDAFRQYKNSLPKKADVDTATIKESAPLIKSESISNEDTQIVGDSALKHKDSHPKGLAFEMTHFT